MRGRARRRILLRAWIEHREAALATSRLEANLDHTVTERREQPIERSRPLDAEELAGPILFADPAARRQQALRAMRACEQRLVDVRLAEDLERRRRVPGAVRQTAAIEQA